MRDELTKIIGYPTHISIEEVRKPALDARLVAENIAQQLESVMFRRAMKRAVTSALRLGAEGIKSVSAVVLAERKLLVLNGIERVEFLCIHSEQI